MTPGISYAGRRPAFGRGDRDRIRKRAAADAPASHARPTVGRAGQPVGAGQQLQTAADPAGGRNCDRGQTGPRYRQRPHYPGGERSHRSGCFLRGAGSLGGQQRQVWSGDSGWRNAVPAPMAAPEVRAKAMAEKDQQQVWSEVAKTRAAMAETVTARGSRPSHQRTRVRTRE